MWQKQTHKSSLFRESIKALEADIQHANTIASSLPRSFGGYYYIQMKLSYAPLSPIFLLFIEWMDFCCTDYLPSYLGLLHILVYKVYVDGMPSVSSEDRKATLKEFYAVIYPSLKQLQDCFTELMEESHRRTKICNNMRMKGIEEKKICGKNVIRDDECGICMEACTKIVLPDCGHSMCNGCFHDWIMRSQSCPFCRDSLEEVRSGDLWVLTSKSDVIEIFALAKENLINFYSYIMNLSLMVPETHLYTYDYLI